MRPVAFIARGALVTLAGCAPLLGGLDDGAPRDGGAVDASPAAPRADVTAGDAACSAWLDGFRYRVRFDVDSAAAAREHSLAVSLNTRRLVAANKLRSDGADLRVTGPDGTSVVPHWIESGLGGEATIVWTKVDLAPGANGLYLYYGNLTATDTASLDETFVPNIIANAQFQSGSAPWAVEGQTNGVTPNLAIEPGRARVAFDGGLTEPWAVGLCQTVTFPPGDRYRLVFDNDRHDLPNARFIVWVRGVGGTRVWTSAEPVGPERGLRSDAIEPGTTRLCVGGASVPTPIVIGHAVNGSFSNLRVARYAEVEPVAGMAGREETGCASR